jgi:hypothetical protein
MRRRLLSRLSCMSAAELRWRASTAIRTSWDRTRVTLRYPAWNRRALAGVLATTGHAVEARAAARAGDWTGAHRALTAAVARTAPRFPVAPFMREELSARIRNAFPASAADAAARADRILAGDFDLLGYTALRFETALGAPDWHFDPVNRRRAPIAFWSAVPYLDPRCGDHKVIWELNRQQHLLAFGRAYWLTGDARYRDGAIQHVRDWMRFNPPLVGINWASMLELAFRVLSWTWMLHICADDEGEHDPWLVDLTIALDRQLLQIQRNLSHYFSPNTHLLGEALALYVAGQSLPWLRRAESYARTGRRILIDEIARQIGADGGHLERSTHYHRYTLDFYLLALSVARITNDPAAALFAKVVSKLGFAARLLADDRGRLPHLGDDDGGMLLPICGRAPDDIRDSLATASALVGRPDLRISGAPEETYWLLAHPALDAAFEQGRAMPPAAAVTSAALADTGYYISRSPAGDHIVIDAGAHGLANGGHAHADALSLTLSLRGVPLLIDPGTASYTADPDARDRFRSSALHNTLTVDGRSQSLPAGPFHWVHTAHATAHLWRTNPGFDYLEGSHDGYAPLVHRRHVLALHGDLLIVADLVEGLGVHDVDVHWHLDPRWQAQVSGRRARLRTPGERAELVVSHGMLESFRGEIESPLGWHAPVYGRIEPTTTLRVSTSAVTPAWVVSVFGLNPSNEVLVVEPMPVWAEAGVLTHGTAVRISRAASVDLFAIGAQAEPPGDVAADPRRTWRLANYETDARVLFCRTRDGVARVALVDGSLVRSTDRHALDLRLPRLTPDLHLDLARSEGRAPSAAHVTGVASGALVQFAGAAVPIAAERRATARASSRRRRDATQGPTAARADR